MNATFRKSSFLSVLILIFLTGCLGAYQPAVNAAPQILSGDVQAVGPGTAKMIVEQALKSAPGSSIWFQGGNYIFASPIGSNYGWVILNAEGSAPIDVCSGNISSCATFQGLVSFLIKQGWTQLATLPEYTVTTLIEYAGALTTLAIIPGVAPYNPVPTGIVQ
jgi:hypothetical protein